MSEQRNTYRNLAIKFVEDRYGIPSTLHYYREEWWAWVRGRYQVLSDSNIKARIKGWLDEEGEDSKDTPVRELRSAVMALPNVIVDDSLEMPIFIELDHYDYTCNYLAFKDRIVDLDVISKEGITGATLSPTPRWFSPVVLDYVYDPKVDCPLFKAFLDRVLPDKPSQAVMQEWFGYCLTRDTDMRAMLILYGESGTGKSTLSNILEAIVGKENRSAVPLECFWDRFAPQQTLGKLVNLCGDSRNIDSLAEGVIKRFTGGDTLLVDRKYKQPVSAKMTAKLMVTTNVFPRVKDTSDALWNRFIVVPMDVIIPDNEVDRSLLGSEEPGWPLRKELPGIFNWAIGGLKRLRKQGHFTLSQSFQQVKYKVRSENCTVAQFVQERCEPGDLASVSIKNFMHEYVCFCDNQASKPLPGVQVTKILPKLIPGVRKKWIGSRGQQQSYFCGIKMRVPRDE